MYLTDGDAKEGVARQGIVQHIIVMQSSYTTPGHDTQIG